ncbi:hypothetical protein E2320_000636, partial [Naja naja]
MQPLWFSSLIFCTASLMLMLIALFTPYWVTESTPHGLLHGGLWSICLDPNCDFYPINLANSFPPLLLLFGIGTLFLLGMCILTYIYRNSRPYTQHLIIFGSSYSLAWACIPMFFI